MFNELIELDHLSSIILKFAHLEYWALAGKPRVKECPFVGKMLPHKRRGAPPLASWKVIDLPSTAIKTPSFIDLRFFCCFQGTDIMTRS